MTCHLNPEEERQTPMLLSIPGDPQKQFLNASRFNSQSFQCWEKKIKVRKISPTLISSVLKLARFQSHSALFIGPEVHRHMKNNDNSIFLSKSWISCGNVRAFVKHGTFTKGFGGKYLQEESDGWSSLGACPHQSHSAETNSRTSLDCVLQLHHCAHFHWGEAYIV